MREDGVRRGQPATATGAGAGAGSGVRCRAGSRASTTRAPAAETAAQTHEPAETPSSDDCWTAVTASPGSVRYGMDRAVLRAGDVRETAQLIWSAVHGAVDLELGGVLQTPDPAANYEALLQMLLDGLR